MQQRTSSVSELDPRAMFNMGCALTYNCAYGAGKWAYEHRMPLAIGAAVTLAAPVGLAAFGLGSAGPVAGTLAAKSMSAIAIFNEVGVPAGSLYAIAQAFAMGKTIVVLKTAGVVVGSLAAVGATVGEDRSLRSAAGKVSETARFGMEACNKIGATAARSAVNAYNEIGASASRYLSSPEGVAVGVAIAKSTLALSPFLLAPIGAPFISSRLPLIPFAIARGQGMTMGKPALSSSSLLPLSPLAIARDQGEASRVAALKSMLAPSASTVAHAQAALMGNMTAPSKSML